MCHKLLALAHDRTCSSRYGVYGMVRGSSRYADEATSLPLLCSLSDQRLVLVV